MSFEEEGYLTSDVSEITQTITKNYKELFEICYKVNRVGHSFIKNETIDSNNLQEVITLCFLLRILDGHQSSIILCQRGLTINASVILRSTVEAMILMRYVAKDQENLNKYILIDQYQRRKLINVILNDKNGVFSDSIREGITRDLIDQIENSIAELNISELKVEEIAKKVGMHSVYQRAYRVLSSDVHVLPRSLQKYLVIDKNKNINAMNFLPKDDDIPEILEVSGFMLILAIDTIAELLQKSKIYSKE